MFSFFGLFTDAPLSLSSELRRLWPDCDIVQIDTPFRGFAVRLSERVYTPSDEDIPASVRDEVQLLSVGQADSRFVLLRTECWGGTCGNWGLFIQGGVVVDDLGSVEMGQAGVSGTLRRLISHLGADIGEQEIFDPLCRSFPWKLV